MSRDIWGDDAPERTYSRPRLYERVAAEAKPKLDGMSPKGEGPTGASLPQNYGHNGSRRNNKKERPNGRSLIFQSVQKIIRS
jgi:hypothetical protein